MARVLVSEEISDKGLDLLREAGHEVDVQIGLDEAGLAAAIVGAQAIIIRSATTVSAELLSAGTDLKIVSGPESASTTSTLMQRQNATCS